jgi:protease I
MTADLTGKTVAILATDGFEQAELLEPQKALKAAGATVDIVSLKTGPIQGFDHLTPGQTVEATKALSDVRADAYDALMLPGGASNPDALRIEPAVQTFVKAFFDADKTVGVICHAPWILIDAGLADGRTLTSYKTIRQDLKNAGANVLDQEVVVDGNLITSRNPDDLPAFCAKLVEMVG